MGAHGVWKEDPGAASCLHRLADFVVVSIANLGCGGFNSTAESHKQEL